ncbi:MAG: galactokinase [Oscillospiraceae bacterium]|nr:galactokinase [Oscillospiraceae bacterium]
MSSCQELISALNSGLYAPAFSRLYPSLPAPKARLRALSVAESFVRTFPSSSAQSAVLFSSPGRTELGGNHTDHQHGRVLCAAVELDILACAAPNATTTVRLLSEGYPLISVDLNDLAPRPGEAGTSEALVRGIAARMVQAGHIPSGFDACLVSAVPAGSGLSSSAAFEILIGVIFNHFFCGSAFGPIQLAQMGQYAENLYFGKPCGLMDQLACAYGGVTAIDFRDPSAPVVEAIPFDFSASSHALCIIDTGSCHADLTDDYAAIPREMGAVAAVFGKSVLRDVSEEDFLAALPSLRQTCGDRAVLRALHFYRETNRAAAESQALHRGDLPAFLSLVNESGLSSALLLQNSFSPAHPRQQAVSYALAAARELLQGEGAVRVHGGGFAGTIQAFVPRNKLSAFIAGMETFFAPGCCHCLQIRPAGGCALTPAP